MHIICFDHVYPTPSTLLRTSTPLYYPISCSVSLSFISHKKKHNKARNKKLTKPQNENYNRENINKTKAVKISFKKHSTKKSICFVLTKYSWAWGLSLGVVYKSSDSPLERTDS